MDFVVEAPETADRVVVVRIGGIWSEPELWVDGKAVAPVEGRYLLPKAPAIAGADTAEDKNCEIRLKTPLLDFVPIVTLDNRRVEIAPPLSPLIYIWCAVPTVLLIAFGRGVLPALVGLALSYVSLYQMRAAPTTRRFIGSGIINLLVILFCIGLVALHHHSSGGGSAAAHHLPTR